LGPGFKYHIVSISAIFFALTIGLVVGSVFVSPQFANRQQAAIIRLQQTLNSDMEANRREIRQYEETVKTLSPLALKGKLGSSGVAIIQTGDYPEDAISAGKAIAVAEPRTIVHLVISNSLERSEDEVRAALADAHARNALIPDSRDALCQTLATVLAKGDAVELPLLPQCEREGLIRLSPDDNYAAPIKYAVIVGGSRTADSTRATRVDAPLIRALLKQGISVVACEGQNAAASDIPSYRLFRTEISTIDNVDSDIGRCALVLAFGGPPTPYGVKVSAERLLPSAGGSD